MTPEKAIALSATKFWERCSAEKIVKFQLFQKLLCMPFPVFHDALEKVLGRSIWTHEFVNADRLRAEYLQLKNNR